MMFNSYCVSTAIIVARKRHTLHVHCPSCLVFNSNRMRWTKSEQRTIPNMIQDRQNLKNCGIIPRSQQRRTDWRGMRVSTLALCEYSGDHELELQSWGGRLPYLKFPVLVQFLQKSSPWLFRCTSCPTNQSQSPNNYTVNNLWTDSFVKPRHKHRTQYCRDKTHE